MTRSDIGRITSIFFIYLLTGNITWRFLKLRKSVTKSSKDSSLLNYSNAIIQQLLYLYISISILHCCSLEDSERQRIHQTVKITSTLWQKNNSPNQSRIEHMGFDGTWLGNSHNFLSLSPKLEYLSRVHKLFY